MNSPQVSGLSPAGLEGKVGEVVGGEPKKLLRWVWPQHTDDGLAKEAPDESLTSRSPRQDVGTRRSGKGAPGDGLRRPGVDEAEGAEPQWPQESTRSCGRPSDPPEFVETHDVPLPGVPTVGVLYRRQ
jgi:hypothetical protein